MFFLIGVLRTCVERSLGACALAAALGLNASVAYAADSVCYGTPAHGRIENAAQLPKNGSNFRAYSQAGVAFGRTYAHARVVRAVESAYAQLATAMPKTVFVYGETGFERGGRFRPLKRCGGDTTSTIMSIS